MMLLFLVAANYSFDTLGIKFANVVWQNVAITACVYCIWYYCTILTTVSF